MKFIPIFLLKNAPKIGDYNMKLQKYLLLKIHSLFFYYMLCFKIISWIQMQIN